MMEATLKRLHREAAPVLVCILDAVARRRVRKSQLSEWATSFRRWADDLDQLSEVKSEARDD
jgi:hypothetical protein